MRNRQLFSYIVQERGRGIPDDAIRKALLEKGWSPELIDEAFSETDIGAAMRKLETRMAALEETVQRLAGTLPAAPRVAAFATPAFAETMPPPPLPPSYIPQKPKEIQWEAMLGGNWLARVGIAALVLGVAFFLKLAFDNDWIGERGRVILGILGGLSLLGLGEYWKEKYKIYAQIISGGGIAILYLSLFAAAIFYHLVPAELAFVFMAAVTAAAGLLAIRYESPGVAIAGILGGFVTPLLFWREFSNEFILLIYIAILDLGILALASFRNWRPLTLLGLAGSLVLFGFWTTQVDVQEKLGVAAGALTVFWLIFVAATTLFHLLWRRVPDRSDLALMSLNAASYFAISYLLLKPDWDPFLGLFAFGLAACYGLLAYGALSFAREHAMLSLFLGGIALVLLTLAIPIQLSQNWITIAWAVEAVVLVWFGFLFTSWHMRVFGLGVLVIAATRLFFLDMVISLRDFTPVLNARFLTFAVVIASAYAIAYFYAKGRALLRDDEKIAVPVLALAANFATLWILSAELISLFDSRALAAQTPRGPQEPFLPASERDYAKADALRNAKNFSLSAMWAVYAIAMITVGIFRRSRVIRLAALLLLWATIFKVFLFDSLGLEEGYRVAAFITLGIILLATAFLYNRFKEHIREFFLEEEKT